ncbi:glycosyltransferase [Brevibacterium album]|uniref:glycosyltransferase n=1 Tax=Brevibacterium album TaxID=417948 RepID=UPI000427FCBD|nr:glycosyltransferase [Brevibacterium album]
MSDGPRADTAAAIGRAAQGGELGAAVTALGEAFSFEAVLAEVQRQASAADLVRSGEKVFVTVGRLSPEKNHERLLRAFAQVHAEAQDTRLVIIGGGPLGTELAALAGSLGIARAVTFTGVLSNPYGVMAESDCFVMSSDYEGQPIVILEARVLGLPVLTTRFGSAESAMEGSDGLIVERSVDALAEGMRAYLRGETGARRLDPAQYNAEVVEEFRRAVLG